MREESTVTINNNETELVISFHHAVKFISVELVIAHVQGARDSLEGFNINGELLFFVVFSQDSTTVDDHTIWRNFGEELNTTKSGGNGSLNGNLVGVGFDVGASTEFVGEHGGDLGDLSLRGDEESDDGSTNTTSSFKSFDEFLELETLNVFVGIREGDGHFFLCWN